MGRKVTNVHKTYKWIISLKRRRLWTPSTPDYTPGAQEGPLMSALPFHPSLTSCHHSTAFSRPYLFPSHSWFLYHIYPLFLHITLPSYSLSPPIFFPSQFTTTTQYYKNCRSEIITSTHSITKELFYWPAFGVCSWRKASSNPFLWPAPVAVDSQISPIETDKSVPTTPRLHTPKKIWNETVKKSIIHRTRPK